MAEYAEQWASRSVQFVTLPDLNIVKKWEKVFRCLDKKILDELFYWKCKLFA